MSQPIVKLHNNDVVSNDEAVEKDSYLKDDQLEYEKLEEAIENKVDVSQTPDEIIDDELSKRLSKRYGKELDMPLTKIPKTFPLFPYRLKKKADKSKFSKFMAKL